MSKLAILFLVFCVIAIQYAAAEGIKDGISGAVSHVPRIIGDITSDVLDFIRDVISKIVQGGIRATLLNSPFLLARLLGLVIDRLTAVVG